LIKELLFSFFFKLFLYLKKTTQRSSKKPSTISHNNAQHFDEESLNQHEENDENLNHNNQQQNNSQSHTKSNTCLQNQNESPNILTNAPFCQYCSKSFCNKYFLRTHMNKAHGKTLIIENNTNNTMINSIINSNNNNNNNGSGVNHLVNSGAGYTSGNEDDGELMTDQQNLDETYFASKIVDRVACDICNKQVCNKYFLRTHKQKVHGIFDTSPSNVLASLSENAKYKSNPLSTSTLNQNRTFNAEGEEEEEIIANELRYDDGDDTDDYNMMMIDEENDDENEEDVKYRNRKNGANNRKSDENDDNNESASGKELGELVLNAEPGESFGHDEVTVNKNQNIVEKKRRMSTCSDSTTSKMIFYYLAFSNTVRSPFLSDFFSVPYSTATDRLLF
jgi:hypothetical protein